MVAAARRRSRRTSRSRTPALDLLGQARGVLTRAGQLEAERGGDAHDEDQLAFLRDERDYRNLTLVELPRGDFAVTVLRNFLMATFLKQLWHRLAASSDAELAGVAAKAVKEATLPPGACRRLGRAPRRRQRGIDRPHGGGARPALALHRRDLRGRRRRRGGGRVEARPALGRPARGVAAPTSTPSSPRPASRCRRRARSAAPASRAGTASTWATSWPRCSTCSARSRAACGERRRPRRCSRARARLAGARRRPRPGGAGGLGARPRHRPRRRRARGRRPRGRRHADVFGLPGDRGDRAGHRRRARRRRPRPGAGADAARAGLDHRLDERGRASQAARLRHRAAAAPRRRRGRADALRARAAWSSRSPARAARASTPSASPPSARPPARRSGAAAPAASPSSTSSRSDRDPRWPACTSIRSP